MMDAFRGLRLALGALCVGAIVSPTVAQDSPAAGLAIVPLEIRAQTPVIKPGEALSVRSLVTEPAPLTNVLSWTIESRRHRGMIHSATVSPNGKLAATGGLDGTIRVWELATGRLLRILIGHDTWVPGLSWSPCGRVLASVGAWDGTIRLWDPRAGQLLRVFTKVKTPILRVAWSPDGTRLVAAVGASGALWLWTVAGDAIQTPLELGQHGRLLEWSPDGKRLAAAGARQPVSIIDLDSHKAGFSLGQADAANHAAAWSPDGQRIVLSGRETHVWDVERQTSVLKLVGASRSVAWSPDGSAIATASAGDLVRVWDAASGKLRKRLTFETRWPSISERLVWRRLGDGSQQIVHVSALHAAAWRMNDGKLLCHVEAAGQTPPLWTPGRPVLAGLASGKLSLWDGASAKRVAELEGHTGPVAVAAWNRDAKRLASAGYDGSIRLWDADGKLEHALDGHREAVNALAWAPNGRQFATAGDDKTIRLWSAEGKSAGLFEGHTASINALAWTPQGNLLVSGGADEAVRVWDPKRPKEIRSVPIRRSILALACTAAGKNLYLACGADDDVVRVLEFNSGRAVANLTSRGEPPSTTALAWMSSPGMLFAGRGNHTALIWEVSQAKIVHRWHTMAPAEYVGTASGGALLFAGSRDGTVRFWDAAKQELRATILDDGRNVSLISYDGHFRIDPESKSELLYVVALADGQHMLSADEFATRFRWRNNPLRVKFPLR